MVLLPCTAVVCGVPWALWLLLVMREVELVVGEELLLLPYRYRYY
jgi:hypothetical protein